MEKTSNAFVYLVKMPVCSFKNAILYPLAKCPHSYCPFLKGHYKQEHFLKGYRREFLKEQEGISHLLSQKCPSMCRGKMLLFKMPFQKGHFELQHFVRGHMRAFFRDPPATAGAD